MLEHPEDRTIGTDACWALLASERLGRLALSMQALPVILPVEYALDGETLALCLHHYRVDPRAIHDVVVGFAVDALDPDRRSGWTVQVQGLARLAGSPDDPVECAQPPAGQIVRLFPQTVTGQRFDLCPFVPPLGGNG